MFSLFNPNRLLESFAKEDDWRRLQDAFRRVGIEPPSTGDMQCYWVPYLADELEKLAQRIEHLSPAK